MKTFFLICFCLLPVFVVLGQPSTRQNAPGEQGRYIVERVAMCIECHTPRNEKGELIKEGYLRGATMPVKAPPYVNLEWALKAPAIAGLPGYTNDEAIRLLTEGVTRDGRIPTPPMPRFRLNRTDAQAVVTFLKSLP